ncbi:MAG: hypothetical protein SFU25_06800 [Candidatus Caenarcaniphilales bacterium]|nr:hypothetical protein [Candidatus Caenarcaniphilales bacterium]
MKKHLLLFTFLLLSLSSLSVLAKHPCEDPRLKDTIHKMDEMAEYFKTVECPVDDRVCWWFRFHLAIGEVGSAGMTQFAKQVPLDNHPSWGYANFMGEAHIAQYPAYYLLKGIDKNTPLKSKTSFVQYLDKTPWKKMYTDTVSKENTVNINHELSWYWIAKAKYPSLPMFVQSTAPYEEACEGGHHLPGLYFSNDPSFPAELKEFNDRLKKLVIPKVVPASMKSDPYIELKRFYALSHAFEDFMLTDQKKLISQALIDRAVEHVDKLEEHYKINKPKFKSASEFFHTAKMDGYFHYYYGDTLGHFRYGIHMCTGRDVVPE